MSDLLQINLLNLHEFWCAMATKSDHSEIHVHSSWPNKIWHSSFIKLENTQWQGRVHVTTEKPLPQVEYKVSAQLTAMHMALSNANGKINPQVAAIQSLADIEAWCASCSLAFGYEINAQAIFPLLNDDNATLLTYQVDNKIAATAILYQSNNNMGVHQVGVLPNFQGHGIGKALMLHAVELAKINACSSMTLQASKKGLPLYLKMGFTKLSTLYHLDNNSI